MNKMTQAALAALVLGFCSTAIYADGGVETAGFNQGGGNDDGHKRGRHGCGTKCDGDIDIELYVEKHCDLDIDKEKITMTKNSSGGKWSGNSSFDVRANSPYSLNITKPSHLVNQINPTEKIAVGIDTKLGLVSYNSGTVLPYSSSTRTFAVKAETTSAVSDMAHWGLYKGTYKVAVAF